MKRFGRWLPFALIGYLLFAIFNPRNFAVSDYKYVTLKELELQLRTSLEPHRNGTEGNRQLCPALPEYSHSTIKSIQQNSSFWSLDDFELDEKSLAQNFDLEPGGAWRPKTCNPVHHVSLIVPYRDRSVQLKKFIFYMHTFLQFQMVHYKIIVIEQKDELPFNRGKLLNVGFHEAVKQGYQDACLIFHDVDLLPESLHNVYGCAQRPRHMSAVVNTFRYTLQYLQLFGGAVAMTKEVFQSVNGFSNTFFGWGGEDDDLYSRLKHKGIEIIRLSPAISSYRMLPHKKAPPSLTRFEQLNSGKDNYDYDGLNSLKFSISNHIANPLYTLIQVKL